MAKNFLYALTLKKASEGNERKATWIELFFDLAFVVALAKAVHILGDSITAGNLIAFLITFFALFVSWSQSTFYTDRFDTDDPLHRLTYFAQMVGVLGMAAFVDFEETASADYFCTGFLIVRSVLLVNYLRASINNPHLKNLTRTLIVYYSATSLPWLASLFVEEGHFLYWTVGLLLDGIAPMLLAKTLASGQSGLSHSHLPERFGLLAILTLGECIVSSSNLIAYQGELASPVFALVLLLVVFCCWWIYFDNIDNKVVCHSFFHLLIWEYTHVVVLLGFLWIAVGIRTMPYSADNASLGAFIFGAGVGLATIAIGLLHAVCYLNYPDERTRKQIFVRSLAGIACVVAGLYGFISGDYLLITGIIAGICLFQVYFDISLNAEDS